MSTIASSKVWLITGCSSGFGSELARAALAHGDKVIATGRNVTKLESLKVAGAATLALDVTAGEATVQKAIHEALQIYGAIDILVNNAGYGVLGTIEECSDEETRAQFETNVFGVLSVTRAVLPHMRSRKTGVIANIGSIVGWQSFPGSALYSGTKFALVGITDGLRQEVAHLGIEVTVIEPGTFRTNLLDNLHRASKRIEDFQPFMDPVREMVSAVSGKQPGDPAKGAQLIVEVLTKSGRCEGRTLPLRLPLGSDSVPYIGAVLERETKSLGEWADIVRTTDLDDVAQSKSAHGASLFNMS